MLSLLIHSDSEEAHGKIQISNSDLSDSSDEEATICPNNCNVMTNDQSQEELLSEIIEKIYSISPKA